MIDLIIKMNNLNVRKLIQHKNTKQISKNKDKMSINDTHNLRLFPIRLAMFLPFLCFITSPIHLLRPKLEGSFLLDLVI